MLDKIVTTLMVPIITFSFPFGSGFLKPKPLAGHSYSLDDRYSEKDVNQIFKDNILLTLAYMSDPKIDPAHIDWTDIEKPHSYTLSLKPGETFAFHDDVLPEYKGKVTKTTNAHFDYEDGFKSDGYLFGDGVCHLASIMYWVARDAGLSAVAPTRHDFAPVPDVPEQFGVSIYDNPTENSMTNEVQNLYITNNKDKPIIFTFQYDGNSLTVQAAEK